LFPASRVTQLNDADLFETFFEGCPAIGIVLDSRASIGGYFLGHPSRNVMTWDFLDPALTYINHGSRWVAAELDPGEGECELNDVFFTGERLLAFRFAGFEPDTARDYVYDRLSRSRLEFLPPSAVAIPRWGIWSDMRSHIAEPDRPLLSSDDVSAGSLAHQLKRISVTGIPGTKQ
jgi:hypothetical protein